MIERLKIGEKKNERKISWAKVGLRALAFLIRMQMGSKQPTSFLF